MALIMSQDFNTQKKKKRSQDLSALWAEYKIMLMLTLLHMHFQYAQQQ